MRYLVAILCSIVAHLVESSTISANAEVNCTHDINIVRQQMAHFQNITDELNQLVRGLTVENNVLRRNVSSIKLDNDQLQRIVSALQIKNDRLERDVTAFQSEKNNLLMNVSALRVTNDILHRNMTDLKLDNDHLKMTVSIIKLDKESQASTIENITKQLEDIYSRVHGISSNMSIIKNDVSGLIRGVTSIEQKTTVMDVDLILIKKELLLLEKKIKDQFLNVSNVIQQITDPSTNIGFTAKNSANINNIVHGQIIVFNTIVSNFQSCYNPSTGIFTAARTGVYIFYADIRTTWGDQGCWINFVRNGSPLTALFVKSKADIFTADSTLAVVRLETGDRVWLLNHGHDHCSLDYDMTFSGYLLRVY